ncbi:MAG: putative ABC transporter permease [Syntrophomonas sp.]
MMNTPLVDLIWYFIFYAWLGWILESGYKTVRDRRPVNSGFLSGPLVPIYGFGAIGVIRLLNVVDPMVSSLNPALKIIIELAATTALASMLELGTGVLLESLFHKRWWDYSDERFNLLGLVSLKYSVLWGGLSFLALNIIQPHMDTIVSIIPINIKIAAMVFLVVYLALDLAQRCMTFWNCRALVRPWASHGSLPSWHRQLFAILASLH